MGKSKKKKKSNNRDKSKEIKLATYKTEIEKEILEYFLLNKKRVISKKEIKKKLMQNKLLLEYTEQKWIRNNKKDEYTVQEFYSPKNKETEKVENAQETQKIKQENIEANLSKSLGNLIGKQLNSLERKKIIEYREAENGYIYLGKKPTVELLQNGEIEIFYIPDGTIKEITEKNSADVVKRLIDMYKSDKDLIAMVCGEFLLCTVKNVSSNEERFKKEYVKKCVLQILEETGCSVLSTNQEEVSVTK